MSLKQTSRFLSFKVLNFVSLKLGKFFKFRTLSLEVMKLRGVYREGRASKMGNLTGPFYKHNFITSKVLNLKTLLSSSRFPIEEM